MTQDRLLIREATVDEAPTIAKLHASSWQATYRGIMPDHYLNNEALDERIDYWTTRMRTPGPFDRLVVIAEYDGNAAGFASAEREADSQCGLLLNNLHVSPAYHGRGMGKSLVEAIERWARGLGETQLYLYVFEDNRQAISFYERQGWRYSGREVHEMVGTPITARRYVRPIADSG
jgi:GNAT superfamily N-acetyltransferase